MTHQPKAHPSCSTCNRKFVTGHLIDYKNVFVWVYVTEHLLPNSAATLHGHGEQFAKNMAPVVYSTCIYCIVCLIRHILSPAEFSQKSSCIITLGDELLHK
jgi:hypothetical protein